MSEVKPGDTFMLSCSMTAQASPCSQSHHAKTELVSTKKPCTEEAKRLTSRVGSNSQEVSALTKTSSETKTGATSSVRTAKNFWESTRRPVYSNSVPLAAPSWTKLILTMFVTAIYLSARTPGLAANGQSSAEFVISKGSVASTAPMHRTAKA